MLPLTRAHTGGTRDVPVARGAARAAEPNIGRTALVVHVVGLLVIPTMITYWWPNETTYQVLIEYPKEHEYVGDLDVQQVYTSSRSFWFIFPFLCIDVRNHL